MLRAQIADRHALERERKRKPETSDDLPDGYRFESLGDIDLTGFDPSIPVAFPELYALPEAASDG